MVATVPYRYRRFGIMSSGNVPNVNWNRDNRQLNVNANDPDNRNDNIGTRPTVRDAYLLWQAFNQPPSMRPISARVACIWKSLVSLTSFSSKSNRVFSVAISRWLLARIR